MNPYMYKFLIFILFFQEQRPEKPLLRTHNFPEQAFTLMEQNSSENRTNLDGQIGQIHDCNR